jgi:hypothetical protein
VWSGSIIGSKWGMFAVEMLSKRSCQNIEQLLGFPGIQWEWLMYLELVQSWHWPEEEILGWAKHGRRLQPSGR